MGRKPKTVWKRGWIVNHLWDNAPEPLYFWNGEVAERYIDEAFLWVDINTGDPLAECREVEIPDYLFKSVHTGFPDHQVYFCKSATYMEDPLTGRLTIRGESTSDANLYFDSLYYDPDAYPALYADGDMHLEVIPYRSMSGERRVHIYVEGPSFSEVEDLFDHEAKGLTSLTMEDFEEIEP